MSDRAAELAGGLIRRLARHLNRRVSEFLLLLFNHKSAGSVGAIAGFALAVVFTWKFLRPPPGAGRRNRPKRRVAPSTGRGGAVSGSGGGEYASDLSLRARDEIEGVGSSVELTLGKIVRRKFAGSRKLTCQLLGVVFEERTPEELQKHATVRPSVVEILMEISKFCDLYLMETVFDDQSEERVLSALEGAGLFETGGLIKEKVLFCSTEIGRCSFVRQLEADWHIDANLEIIMQLSRFIRHQLHITPTAHQTPTAPNVFTSTSLEQYLSYL